MENTPTSATDTSEINNNTNGTDPIKTLDTNTTIPNATKPSVEGQNEKNSQSQKINETCENDKETQKIENIADSATSSEDKQKIDINEDSTNSKDMQKVINDGATVSLETSDHKQSETIPRGDGPIESVNPTADDIELKEIEDALLSPLETDEPTDEDDESCEEMDRENIDLTNGIDNPEVEILNQATNVPNLPIPENAINSALKSLLSALQTTANGDNIFSQIQSNAPKGYVSETEWKKRETALLVKIAKMEQDEQIKKDAYEMKLKMKSDENEMTKAKLKTLELELRAVCSKPNEKNKGMVAKIKKQHDELLTKARGMIFEKTKMIKNQELQIEALRAQVTSLKDMVAISKDMLNIRNMECQHLQARMEALDMRLKAEKERHRLMEKKLESGNTLNDGLKKEYLIQMELFKKLKSKYEEMIALHTANRENSSNPTPESQ